ncbi:MAG TPA: endolytic transglycosylase MltG [Candidatus Blautia merdipullorum]|nr:endolytic transglycosylase MltG [Candidatus Blautia merdipullorum]
MGEQVRKQKRSSIIAGGFFRFAVYLIVAAVVIYIGKTAYDFGYNIFYQQPMDSEEEGRDVTVAVEEGDSVYQIGRTLESRGLIQDAKVFVVQEKLSNYSGKLQPGTYILNTSMTPDEIMEILAKENVAGQPDQTQDGETEQAGSSELQEGSDASGEAEQGGAEE